MLSTWLLALGQITLAAEDNEVLFATRDAGQAAVATALGLAVTLRQLKSLGEDTRTRAEEGSGSAR